MYGDPSLAGTFDAVATCFFIDTAHNVVHYLQIIAQLLRPGGAWVNLGPLLYHWAGGAAGRQQPSAAHQGALCAAAPSQSQLCTRPTIALSCSATALCQAL